MSQTQQVKECNVTNTQIKYIIPSKKIQINNFQHQLVQQFIKQMKDGFQNVTSIVIQGNSYSLDFCKQFAYQYLAKSKNLISLDISDIFVARLKQQIPPSIEHMSIALQKTNLIKLDISHNAVNPFGAKALLNFLNTAKTLQVLLIHNCGLGILGVTQIAKGLEGTPNLKTLSIGRNRMQNAGILQLSKSLKFVPKLEELFVYQNTLRKQGLSQLFSELRTNCKSLVSLDLQDNFVREQATQQLSKLLQQITSLRNLNLSDCINQGQCQKLVEAFKNTKNRDFKRLGFNFIELEDQDLALQLLQIVKQCPLVKLDIIGNQFNKKIKKAFKQAFTTQGVLSRFDDDDQQQIPRLFEQPKI